MLPQKGLIHWVPILQLFICKLLELVFKNSKKTQFDRDTNVKKWSIGNLDSFSLEIQTYEWIEEFNSLLN